MRSAPHFAVQVFCLLHQEVCDGVEQTCLSQSVAGNVFGDESHGVRGDAVHLFRQLLCERGAQQKKAQQISMKGNTFRRV